MTFLANHVVPKPDMIEISDTSVKAKARRLIDAALLAAVTGNMPRQPEDSGAAVRSMRDSDRY